MTENETVLEAIILTSLCSACQITNNLLLEILDILGRDYPKARITVKRIEDYKEASTIPGLEKLKFPALLINGKQVTAGTVPDMRALRQHLQKKP